MLMLFYQAFRPNSVFYAKMVSDLRRKVRGSERNDLFGGGRGDENCHRIWLQSIGGQGDKEKG
jgi:hypothetical protein